MKKLVLCFGIFSAEEKTIVTGAVIAADTSARATAVSVLLPGMMNEEAQNIT